MTALYCGIDLHSNNSVVVVMDGAGKVVYRRRLENDLQRIQQALAPYRQELSAVVVESTFNWYWLVDGLMEVGHRVELANTTAIQQYSGLKHTDDDVGCGVAGGDAAVGDPAHRLHLSEGRAGRAGSAAQTSAPGAPAHRELLAAPESVATQHGRSDEERGGQGPGPRAAGAAVARMRMWRWPWPPPCACASVWIPRSPRSRRSCWSESSCGQSPSAQSIPGVGDILGLTIMLEAGTIGRFPSVGNFASYCRCVTARN